jgi:hypothetical protein
MPINNFQIYKNYFLPPTSVASGFIGCGFCDNIHINLKICKLGKP